MARKRPDQHRPEDAPLTLDASRVRAATREDLVELYGTQMLSFHSIANTAKLSADAVDEELEGEL